MTLAEWWRGRTDRREVVLRGLLVEPVSDEVMKLAGLALGKVPATTIDAIVAAFEIRRTGLTGLLRRRRDLGRLGLLRPHRPPAQHRARAR